jgi:hypothetical protein
LYYQLRLVSFILLMLALAGTAQLLRPDVVLLSKRSDWSLFFSMAGTTYLAILGITAFQLWLGTRFINFIAPIGIDFALWLLALWSLGYAALFAVLGYFDFK